MNLIYFNCYLNIAGGNSIKSESISYEILQRLLNPYIQLHDTELSLKYVEKRTSITDYVIGINFNQHKSKSAPSSVYNNIDIDDDDLNNIHNSDKFNVDYRFAVQVFRIGSHISDSTNELINRFVSDTDIHRTISDKLPKIINSDCNIHSSQRWLGQILHAQVTSFDMAQRTIDIFSNEIKQSKFPINKHPIALIVSIIINSDFVFNSKIEKQSHQLPNWLEHAALQLPHNKQIKSNNDNSISNNDDNTISYDQHYNLRLRSSSL